MKPTKLIKLSAVIVCVAIGLAAPSSALGGSIVGWGDVNKSLIDDPPPDDPPLNDPPADDPPLNDPPADDPPLNDPPLDDLPLDDPPLDDPPPDGSPLDDPPLDDPPPDNPPLDGESLPLSVNLTTINIEEGLTETVIISGGTSPYSAASEDTNVATVSLIGNELIITGVSTGTTAIVVGDSGVVAGAVTVDVIVTPSTKIELLLNITAKETNGNPIDLETIAYEWLLIAPTIGGYEYGILLYTNDGIKDYETVSINDPSFTSATYDFDHSKDTFSFGKYSLENDLGMMSGDWLMYGYAYTLTDISEVVIENVVTLNIQ